MTAFTTSKLIIRLENRASLESRGSQFLSEIDQQTVEAAHA